MEQGDKEIASSLSLLVKGRNLYRLRTCRQPWKNEGERRKVLAEKHRQGTAAIYKRAKRKNVLSIDGGGKFWKVSHFPPSWMSYPKRGKHFGAKKGASSSTHLPTNCNSKQHTVKQGAFENTSRTKYAKPFPRPKKPAHRDSRTLYHGVSEKISESPTSPYHRSAAFGSHSAEFQCEMPYHGPMRMSTTHDFRESHDIQLPWVAHVENRQYFPSRSACGRWANGLLNCSIPGRNRPGSNRCVIAACWKCYRRVEMGCNAHR